MFEVEFAMLGNREIAHQSSESTVEQGGKEVLFVADDPF